MMTQDVLNQAVASATGEDITTIAGLGFVPLTYRPIELEPVDDRPPLMVDWDQLDAQRLLSACGQV